MNDRPPRDDRIKGLDEALQIGKFAPTSKGVPSIEDILEELEVEHRKLGEDHKKIGETIAQLRERLGHSDSLLNTASETILNIIKTMKR